MNFHFTRNSKQLTRSNLITRETISWQLSTYTKTESPTAAAGAVLSQQSWRGGDTPHSPGTKLKLPLMLSPTQPRASLLCAHTWLLSTATDGGESMAASTHCYLWMCGYLECFNKLFLFSLDLFSGSDTLGSGTVCLTITSCLCPTFPQEYSILHQSFQLNSYSTTGNNAQWSWAHIFNPSIQETEPA